MHKLLKNLIIIKLLLLVMQLYNKLRAKYLKSKLNRIKDVFPEHAVLDLDQDTSSLKYPSKKILNKKINQSAIQCTSIILLITTSIFCIRIDGISHLYY